MKKILFVSLVLGCALDPPTVKPTPPEAVYGEPLSEAAAVDLAKVIDAPQQHDGKTLKVRGRVSEVCQKKGCWMILAPPADEQAAPRIRVTFRGYSFFVPKDLAGNVVLAEGVFRFKTIPREEAQHYADDEAAAGKPARKVTGDEVELSLVASGVQVLR